jgi:hypothetical protein
MKTVSYSYASMTAKRSGWRPAECGPRIKQNE